MNGMELLLTAGMVAANGGGICPSNPVEENSGKKMIIDNVSRLRCIDVHNHMVPASYVNQLAGIGITSAGGTPFPVWTPALALEVMDRFDIESGILSLSSPGVYFGEKETTIRLAREMNEAAADAVRANPKRFGFFAHLPLPFVDEAIDEAVYALDHLHSDGIVLLASTGDKFLGDPRFDDLLMALHQRSAVVFIHPNVHSSSRNIGLTMPHFMIEFMFDTTRAVANLLWTGALERYSNIRWIVAHAGATVPYLSWRLSLMDFLPGFKERAPNGALSYLKNLYYDTALSPSPTALAALLQLVDPSHILFGSDFPFAPEDFVGKEIHDLKHLPFGSRKFNGFDEKTLQGIYRSNALALFPRFKQEEDNG
jgi:predicted TIM-barrel fold metal-dependent hydrolase